MAGIVGPMAGMAKYLGRSSYAAKTAKNLPTEGAKGPTAGSQKPTAEGYKQTPSKDGVKRYQDKDSLIRSKAGALDGVTSPKAALTFIDEIS